MTREQEIQDIRDLLDFVEARPDIPIPYFGTVYSFAYSKDGDDPRVLAKAMSPARKKSEGDFFNLERTFGSVTLSVSFHREEVCEQVEVGERLIPAAPERLVAATPEHTEKVYEWKCPDSILKLAES